MRGGQRGDLEGLSPGVWHAQAPARGAADLIAHAHSAGPSQEYYRAKERMRLFRKDRLIVGYFCLRWVQLGYVDLVERS